VLGGQGARAALTLIRQPAGLIDYGGWYDDERDRDEASLRCERDSGRFGELAGMAGGAG
jgi:hypothetical protein